MLLLYILSGALIFLLFPIILGVFLKYVFWIFDKLLGPL